MTLKAIALSEEQSQRINKALSQLGWTIIDVCFEVGSQGDLSDDQLRILLAETMMDAVGRFLKGYVESIQQTMVELARRVTQ